MNEKDKTLEVYKAICEVQADLLKEGITKNRKNVLQNYVFRGIDDVYNALSPLLAKHKLCILPRMINRTMTERETKAGGTLFSVVVEAEFDFVSAVDGSSHIVKTYGEAMDSSDKATNKAMSAAYKYAAFQSFAIPTEGEGHDAEERAHEVKPKFTPTISNTTEKKPVSEAQKGILYKAMESHLITGDEIAGIKDVLERDNRFEASRKIDWWFIERAKRGKEERVKEEEKN